MQKHGRQKLFIDCTSTFRTNIISGVQRVVRQYLEGAPNLAKQLDVEVIPICGQFGNYYNLDDALEMSQDSVRGYEPIQFAYNDLYFCPDAFWSCEIYEWYEYFKSKGVIIVTMIYDLIPLDDRNFTSEQDRKLFASAFEVIVQYSDLLLTPTLATKQQVENHVVSFGKGGIAPQVQVSKIAPIFWANSIVTHKLISVVKDEEKNDFLLMVGTIEKRRGYVETIEALTQYWDDGGKLKLRIVGKVADDSIVNKIDDFCMHGYPIEIMKSVNDDILHNLYRNAEAIICSSLTEGYGLSVAEGLLLNGKVLANKLPVFGEFAGSMPYYFDIHDSKQLVDLVNNIDSLRTVTTPCFIDWEECYDELVSCLVSISPLHEKNVNLSPNVLNKAFIYQTLVTLGLDEPDNNTLNYWIGLTDNPHEFMSMAYYEASKNTNDLSVYYIYQALGLGSPDKQQRGFWKSTFPDIDDFINEVIYASSSKTTDLAIYYIYHAFGLDSPDKETREYWKEHCPNILQFIEKLKEI